MVELLAGAIVIFIIALIIKKSNKEEDVKEMDKQATGLPLPPKPPTGTPH